MLIRILIPVFLLLLGFGAWKWLGQPVDEPVARNRTPQKLKTERLELERTRFPVIIESQGTIRAHHNTTLTPLVGGTISLIHPTFEDGAFFSAGEVLAELDPADLEAAVITSKSRLARAEALLAQEEARAKQARLNWDDIGYEEEPSPLVLRVPQLNEARANVTAAQAELDQSTRNLERAKIRAPFDGRVRSRLVGLGQAVSATTALGEIYPTDFVEVRLPLSPLQMEFVRLPARHDDEPVRVTLTDALGSQDRPGRQTWEARIVRTEGALDEASRELFAIARIDDPFGLESGMPELRIGQPVRAAIEGVVLEDVFVLPRTAMRGLNRIFLIDPEGPSIQRTQIETVWSTPEVVVVRDGLESGDWLAISRLPFAPNGAPVEILETVVEDESEAVPERAASALGPPQRAVGGS
jgi:RND family efflux transporter MFP subunit